MLTPPPMVPIMKSGIIPSRFAPENKFIGLTYRAFIWVPYKRPSQRPPWKVFKEQR